MIKMILGIQILGMIFALFMMYFTYLYFRRKEFTKKEFSFWLVLWIGLLFITLFPEKVRFFVLDVLGMSRTLDFFIIVGFMFLTVIVFYIYVIVRKTQNKVIEIVRKIALKKK